ncbi:MAG: hypothetical protein H6Q73_3580 [Firmicutes bacterium]|nr:hypothetical protein [Bacillota bacterium]
MTKYLILKNITFEINSNYTVTYDSTNKNVLVISENNDTTCTFPVDTDTEGEELQTKLQDFINDSSIVSYYLAEKSS